MLQLPEIWAKVVFVYTAVGVNLGGKQLMKSSDIFLSASENSEGSCMDQAATTRPSETNQHKTQCFVFQATV